MWHMAGLATQSGGTPCLGEALPEPSVGQTDLVWRMASLGGGEERGRKPAPGADLISQDKAAAWALYSALRTREVCLHPESLPSPWIQQGFWICCLDYKLQLQCTSVSEALREPAASWLSPPVIGAMPSLGTGLGQREACLFETCLLQIGKLRLREGNCPRSSRELVTRVLGQLLAGRRPEAPEPSPHF